MWNTCIPKQIKLKEDFSADPDIADGIHDEDLESDLESDEGF